MRRAIGMSAWALCATTWLAAPAHAQFGWGYPGMFGNYGWSQWGANPASGYMAGLGAFARGQGEYELNAAKARSIDQETVERWNKALHARQRALQKDLDEAEAKRVAQYQAEARESAIDRGSTLNFMLDRILDADVLGKKSAALKLPLSASVIRDIPFEGQTEALSMSLNQAIGVENWPSALRDTRLAPQRAAVREAIEAVLAEDLKGEVSAEATKKVADAVHSLHERFDAITSSLDPGYSEADAYLRTLAAMARLLHNPRFQEVLSRLESFKEGTIGDLIGFMHAFNLRFGPATTARQRALYRDLLVALGTASEQVTTAQSRTAAGLNVDTTGKPLISAANDALGKLSWEELHPQAKAKPERP
jgi:hypothetical protein